MKRSVWILSILIISMLPQSTFSQATEAKNYDSESNSSGVFIVDISWHGAFVSKRIYAPQGAFSIDIKNNSGKIITATNWEFFLVDTIRGNRVYDHFTFRTDDKKIKPGEKKRLTKRFNYHTVSENLGAQVRLMRIEYQDGSVWVRKTDEK